MKKFIAIFSVLVCSGLFSFTLNAQTTVAATSTAPPSPYQIQQPQLNLSLSIVYRVLYQAQTPLNTTLQILLSEYYNGNCKIKDLGITPLGDLMYEVKYAGGAVIIAIETNF